MSDDDPPPGWTVPDDLSSIMRDDDLMPSQTDSIQVIGGIDLPDGSPYVCQVLPSDDVAIHLPRDRAIAYAMTVLTAANQAMYFTGVRAQMRDVLTGRGRSPATGDDAANVEWFVQQLVEDLPEPDHEATAPLRFLPGTRRSTGEAVVGVSLPPHTSDHIITGWSPAAARQHALHVLDVAVVCDLDTAYRTAIAKGLESGEQRGRAVVHDLGNYLPRDPDIISELEQRAKQAAAAAAAPVSGKPRKPQNNKARKRRR